MVQSEFTSGPVRELSSEELGVDGYRYTDFELLSDSGHNRVYRAMHAGKRVVLKVAREEEGNATRNRLLLQREYDIMHAIDCIYVVNTWQMADVPGLGRAIVMEYVQGRPFDKFAQEKPPLSVRKRVADELMEALSTLHAHQTVHGDLKPDNILITDVGNHVRLIDFGFSDTDAYVAKSLGAAPSVAYTSQLTSEELTPARDIYALGKLLQMLFPHSARMVTKGCCAMPVSRRYQSVSQVHSALHRCWIWQWLLPLIVVVCLAMAILISSMPALIRTAGVPPAASADMASHEDSTWISLRQEMDSSYRSIYNLYADSITNMPEKTYSGGLKFVSAYTMRIYETKQQLMAENPLYEEQIEQKHVILYGLGYQRLSKIITSYP